ncbi:MAG: nitroreductase [Clostridia bacterium]|nr:nitroreductase [Clostridia bacterium]
MGIEIFKERRSIKSYKKEQIKPEELDAILEAGTYAPTGMNRQSPLIVAFTDEAEVREMATENAKIMGREGIDPFYGAPTVVVVFADSEVNTGMEDACLVLGNMLNAAHAIGIGSCWIHRAREVFETPYGIELKKKLGIADKYVAVGNCILGYPEAVPAVRPRREGYTIKA